VEFEEGVDVVLVTFVGAVFNEAVFSGTGFLFGAGSPVVIDKALKLLLLEVVARCVR
jgi:hypothetical protein